jgi:hypothetical protein
MEFQLPIISCPQYGHLPDLAYVQLTAMRALNGLCRDRIELWWHRSWPHQDRCSSSNAALLSLELKRLPEACVDSYVSSPTVPQKFARKHYMIAVEKILCQRNGYYSRR